MEIPYTVEARPDTGLYNGKLGLWLFLASEVMLFGALFSSYVLLRVGAPEGTWPHTGDYLKETFADFPEEDGRKILGENAINFYGLDRARLQAVADEIGPETTIFN